MVRASGTGALGLVSRLTGRQRWQPQRATRTRIDLPGDVSEDAIVTVWVAPHSYTGQDLVEISTHGSPVIVDLVLRACLAHGARMARAGEFTLRAYLNGRIDLLQAEAVADLVAATTAAQLRVASSHLEGTLSGRIRAIGDGIAELRALLEASLDFPDEGFHFITPAEVARRLADLRAACGALLGSADAGRRLHDGALIAIAGRPNAGKSSLFNALLRRQRAIVTAVPGTTRDLLTETTDFGGVPVTLVDTAGLRETTDIVEREGVARTEETVGAADLVLLVVDPGADEDELSASHRLWDQLGGRGAVCVLSKADVWSDQFARPGWVPESARAVSAMTGSGLAELESHVAGMVGRTSWEGDTLTRARHRSLVSRCAESIARAECQVASGGSEEFVLVDLHDAVSALEDLRGVESSEQVLESIFSNFCIGK